MTSWFMKQDMFLWLVCLSALFSSSSILTTEVKAAENVVLIGRESRDVMFNFTISQGLDTGLANVYHPLRSVLFILNYNNEGFTATVPSASTFKNRIDNIKTGSDFLSFRLRSLMTNDAGLYTCDKITCQQTLLVILGKPSNLTINNITQIIAYSEAELSCSSTSTSLPLNHGLVMKYIWKRNGQIISESANSTLLFMIDKTNKGDRFTCQTYEFDDLKSDISRLLILDPDFGPEQIKIIPASIVQILETERLTIYCKVECKPVCGIEWKRNHQQVSSTSNLTFNNITRQDDGVYTCHAGNKHGTSDSDLTLDILYPPILLSEYLRQNQAFKEISISEDSDLNITLTIDSNPEPDVIWFQNGNKLSNNNVLTEGPIRTSETIKQQLYTNSYQLKHVECKDMANYSSVITNKHGTIKSSTFYIKVLCAPQINGEEYFKKEFAPRVGTSVDIILSVVSYPRPVIKTIYHNNSVVPALQYTVRTIKTDVDYITVFIITKSNIQLNELGYYYIELSNDENNTNITVHFKEKGRSSTPIDLKAIEINALSVTLEWTSTFNGGEIQTFSVWYKHLYGNWTFYNVTYRDPGEGQHVKAIIKNLRDLTAYEFRVSSKNVFGVSNFTPSICVTTKELETPIETAGISGDVGMWVGVALGIAALVVIVVISIICINKKLAARKKVIRVKRNAKFFKDLRESGLPMMPEDNYDLSNRENHLYEELPERSRSPSNSNGTNYVVRTVPPEKPPRTFVEPVEKKNRTNMETRGKKITESQRKYWTSP